MRRFCTYIVLALALCTQLAWAQTASFATDLAAKDDRGFIVGLLEDALGGEGRIVRVEGFAGALSQTATIRQMTIADQAGVWVTLEDVRLNWTRSALLRGKIEVDELSAASLVITRTPQAPDSALPSPQAQGFALPNLPVSVTIDALNIDRIELGRAILGEPAVMSLSAKAQLAEGSGTIALNASRIDGAQGQFIIDASFDATTQMAAINLSLSEAANGITARLLNLPERPDLKLTVAGAGNINSLVADISLETSGIQRLDGEVTLQGNDAEGRNFGLRLDGDLTSLLAKEFHAFFGPRSSLNATGKQAPDGALELSELNLQTSALALRGSAALDSNNAPLRLALQGRIKGADDGPVALPFAGGSTRIEQAHLDIAYDASVSDIIELGFDITALENAGIAIQNAKINLQGALASALDATRNLKATLAFKASGARFETAAQQAAFGDQIDGSMLVDYEADGTLRLDQITLNAAHYSAAGALLINGLSEAFQTRITLDLNADRLSQFSALAGTDLTGQAALAITGTADIGGAFNLNFAGTTTDLGLGVAQIDTALAGITKLNMDVLRDASGTQVPSLTIRNPQIQARMSAALQDGAAQTQFDLTLNNSAQIDQRLNGPVRLSGRADQGAQGWLVDALLQGPFNTQTTLKGRATGAAPSLQFQVEIPDVQPFARQFRGPARLMGSAKNIAGNWQIDTNLNGPYGIAGLLAGTVTGPSPNLRYTLRIPNVAALGAQIDGPLALDGNAVQFGSAWRIDTALSGLSGTRAQVSGRILSGGRLDLTATGIAPVALANPFIAPRNIQGRANFDLALRGPPALSSLSGTLTTSDSRLTVPNLRISLTEIAASIALARGRAAISATAGVSSGGTITLDGPVILNSALLADLAATLNNVRIIDPALYETRLNGRMSLRGPLGGGARIAGRVEVGETNIRVPESQSAGFTIIPSIAHRGASSGTRQTLTRAGLDAATSDTVGSSPRAGFPLDVLVSAPAKIFVRGRGLDAELGGTLRLSGRTNQIISAGRFNLIRGRFVVLGKRFQLSEGTVELQGKFDPFLRFVATTDTNSGTARITIEGPASEPRVTFSSNPEAPQDVVLAQIFFGRDVSKLSAFQALQLASAVATLAGKGGEGIISKLRRGFDLDDLDITTDDVGNTGLRLGKYISDNVYTEVDIGTANTAGVSINVDLSKSITARGTVTSDGNSSVGIYFEKDY